MVDLDQTLIHTTEQHCQQMSNKVSASRGRAGWGAREPKARAAGVMSLAWALRGGHRSALPPTGSLGPRVTVFVGRVEAWGRAVGGQQRRRNRLGRDELMLDTSRNISSIEGGGTGGSWVCTRETADKGWVSPGKLIFQRKVKGQGWNPISVHIKTVPTCHLFSLEWTLRS